MDMFPVDVYNQNISDLKFGVKYNKQKYNITLGCYKYISLKILV